MSNSRQILAMATAASKADPASQILRDMVRVARQAYAEEARALGASTIIEIPNIAAVPASTDPTTGGISPLIEVKWPAGKGKVHGFNIGVNDGDATKLSGIGLRIRRTAEEGKETVIRSTGGEGYSRLKGLVAEGLTGDISRAVKLKSFKVSSSGIWHIQFRNFTAAVITPWIEFLYEDTSYTDDVE